MPKIVSEDDEEDQFLNLKEQTEVSMQLSGLVQGHYGKINPTVDIEHERRLTEISKPPIEIADDSKSEDSFEARKNAVAAAKINLEGFLEIPPTEQERKTRELITLKRSQYEMDEYVKMVQVRNICQESLNTLMDKFNKSDSLARKNKN